MFGTPGFKIPNFAGDVGNALHRGFGTWLAYRDANLAMFSMAKAFPFEDEYLIPSQAGRSFEACFSAMEALMGSELLADYEVALIRAQDGLVKPAIEVPFAIRITGAPLPIPVWFVGYIDVILRHVRTGVYGVTDLKTTRQQVKDVDAKYQYDEQTIPYGIILEHILGQTIDVFDVNYLHVYIDLLEPTIQMPHFTKAKNDISDWHRGLCDNIKRIHGYMEQQWFPRATNGDICFSYNTPCQFSDICSFRDPEVLSRMIQGTPRTELFRSGEEPWITAELPYLS